MGSHLVTIVPSARTWDWVNSIQHLGMENIVFMIWWCHQCVCQETYIDDDDKYILMCWFLLRSTVSVSLLFQWLVLRFRRLGTTHFDHWPNLKKVGWLFNWPHVSLQPGWCSSFFGWVTFKELLRISCLFKLKHSYATIQTPLVHHLFLWWTGNMNPEWKETLGIFYVVAATDSMAPSPLPDITAWGGKFPSTSL